MTDEPNEDGDSWEEEDPPATPTDEMVVAQFKPEADGAGLDGSTPMEAGIQGRLTHAGGDRETPRNEYDWQPYVEVDQPVQKVDD